jgi:hypothetical protein
VASSEFVVGYLPTPPSLRRALVVVCGVVAALGCVVALLLASGQRDPGPAQWKQESTRINGVMHLRPYPFLEIPGENRAILLVRSGKVGNLDDLLALGGKMVEVRGLPLTRNDLNLLEMEDSSEAISAVTDGVSPASDISMLQNSDMLTLRGQIVDPKCFGGAMKPGDGKTHKACAVLCLRGGIPPTLVTADGSSMILTDPEGEPLREGSLEQIVPFVGDSIELRGRAVKVNQLLTLRVDPASIRRL